MAIALARKGIPTTVFEKGQHPAVAPRFNPDRSYSIDITGHGQRALSYIDACDVFDEMLIPFKGIKATAFNYTEFAIAPFRSWKAGEFSRLYWGRLELRAKPFYNAWNHSQVNPFALYR